MEREACDPVPPLTGEDTVQVVIEIYVTEFLAEAEREADEHNVQIMFK